MDFSRLVPESAGASFFFDSLDMTKTTRSGWQLALVGPMRAIVQISSNSSGGTFFLRQPLRVRASMKSRSRAF